METILLKALKQYRHTTGYMMKVYLIVKRSIKREALSVRLSECKIRLRRKMLLTVGMSGAACAFQPLNKRKETL